MDQVGVDKDAVKQCYEDSFVVPNNEESLNALLEEDTVQQELLGIYLHPGLTINDITYRGYLEGKDVHDAICTSFDRQRPDACKAKVDKHFLDTDMELDKKSAFEKAT